MLSRASPEQEKTLAKLVLSATSVKDLRGHTLSQSQRCSEHIFIVAFCLPSLLLSAASSQLTWRVAPQKTCLLS